MLANGSFNVLPHISAWRIRSARERSRCSFPAQTINSRWKEIDAAVQAREHAKFDSGYDRVTTLHDWCAGHQATGLPDLENAEPATVRSLAGSLAVSRNVQRTCPRSRSPTSARILHADSFIHRFTRR
jgi:hypothetical protein